MNKLGMGGGSVILWEFGVLTASKPPCQKKCDILWPFSAQSQAVHLFPPDRKRCFRLHQTRTWPSCCVSYCVLQIVLKIDTVSSCRQSPWGFLWNLSTQAVAFTVRSSSRGGSCGCGSLLSRGLQGVGRHDDEQKTGHPDEAGGLSELSLVMLCLATPCLCLVFTWLRTPYRKLVASHCTYNHGRTVCVVLGSIPEKHQFTDISHRVPNGVKSLLHGTLCLLGPFLAMFDSLNYWDRFCLWRDLMRGRRDNAW